MPLMEALGQRRSTREFSSRPLPPQVSSDVLWAAYGINRPSGDRTAPCWRHIMVIDVYAAMADGVWLYDPKQHALVPYLADDIRALTGSQDFVATAPLDLVYVARGERMRDLSAEERRLYASVDTGFIGQNVYLYCASEGPWPIPPTRRSPCSRPDRGRRRSARQKPRCGRPKPTWRWRARSRSARGHSSRSISRHRSSSTP